MYWLPLFKVELNCRDLPPQIQFSEMQWHLGIVSKSWYNK